jgi:hypothetical protein
MFFDRISSRPPTTIAANGGRFRRNVWPSQHRQQQFGALGGCALDVGTSCSSWLRQFVMASSLLGVDMLKSFNLGGLRTCGNTPAPRRNRPAARLRCEVLHRHTVNDGLPWKPLTRLPKRV